MRIEKDFIGEIKLNDNVYYGISTYRSIDNFDVSNEYVDLRIVYELVNIKKQAAYTNVKLNSLDKTIGDAIVKACDMILNQEFDSSFVVNKYQGGAGTSTNMNVNEVIANVSLELLGKELGEYDYIHPINHINLHQSTNDTFPTAIKISCIKEIRNLANSYSELQKSFQEKESKYGSVLKLARTEFMDALPILAGQMFGEIGRASCRERV